MRHLKKSKKLGRKRDPRKALTRALLMSLIKNGYMKTTLTKAKYIRPKIERLVTKAKVDSLATRRYLLKFIGNAEVTKLVKNIAPKHKDRKGGYTRITKTGNRAGDNGETAIIEFV